MFGTLIICLPSAHTGGEVIVKHHGQTKTLKTSDATQSYACWYSDAMHEVLPVKSGYRCVLTYNLAVKPGVTQPTATAPEHQNKNIRKTLKVWLKEMESFQVESYLYCPLEHEYTEAAMSLQALKANDLVRVQVMQNLTSELPFELFLALLEKSDVGRPRVDDPYFNPRKCCKYRFDDNKDEDAPVKFYGDDTHDMEDVWDTSYAVKSLRALDGTPLASDFHFNRKACLKKNPFRDLNVTEEEYEWYMGNWACILAIWSSIIIR
jgi:hypothetical protein